MYIKFSLLAVTMLSTSAYAADLPRKPTMPAAIMSAAPIASWEGFYAGVHLGSSFAGESTGTGRLGAAFPAKVDSANGFMGGIQLGYDWQFGQVVAGLAGDFSLGGINKTQTQTGFVGSASNRVFNESTLRARLGVLVSPEALLYVTGGLTTANVQNGVATIPLTATIRKNVNGWNLGAGGEYKFNRNWSAFGEFRYTNLPETNFDVTPYTSVVKTTYNNVRVGANYRF